MTGFSLDITVSSASSVRSGHGGFPPSRPLSQEQRETAANILSGYSSGSLSPDDAKTIRESFREAGIRPGRELGALIREAGLDPREIRGEGRTGDSNGAGRGAAAEAAPSLRQLSGAAAGFSGGLSPGRTGEPDRASGGGAGPGGAGFPPPGGADFASRGGDSGGRPPPPGQFFSIRV